MSSVKAHDSKWNQSSVTQEHVTLLPKRNCLLFTSPGINSQVEINQGGVCELNLNLSTAHGQYTNNIGTLI